jgi:hypothetical protein
MKTIFGKKGSGMSYSAINFMEMVNDSLRKYEPSEKHKLEEQLEIALLKKQIREVDKK